MTEKLVLAGESTEKYYKYFIKCCDDFDLFDIYPEMEGYYEGGIVTYLTCSQCGADVEYKLTEEVKENEGEKNE